MSITLKIKLTDDEAAALAQFLKRTGYADYRRNAISIEESYLMKQAGEAIRASLRDSGFDPR